MMRLIAKGVIGGVVGFMAGTFVNMLVVTTFGIEKVSDTSTIIIGYGTTLLFIYVFIKYF